MTAGLRIRGKIFLPIALLIVTIALILAAAGQVIHQRMLDDRLQTLRAITDTAIGIATGLERQAAAGTLSRDEAIARFRDTVHTMHYGEGEYLASWAFDGTIVAHGGFPDLVGKNRIDAKDSHGKPITAAILGALKTADSMVLDYDYPRPGDPDKTPRPKLMVAERFLPWSIGVGTGVYVDDIEAEFRALMLRAALAVLVVAGLAGGVAVMIGTHVTRALSGLATAMGRISAGQLDTEIAGTRRRDEIGDIARGLDLLRTARREVETLRVEREQAKAQAESERQETSLRVARQVEADIAEVARRVDQAAHALTEAAHDMSTQMAEADGQSREAARASDGAASHVEAVAAATEQLAASVAEISRQIATSAEVARAAVQEAETSDSIVRGLAEAVSRIGTVVGLINDIAAQTNLLALNATIEAARAGEAGKGFAVVAHEVKTLATQTAKATDEIAGQIGTVQAETQRAVAAIDAVTATITRISGITGGIAAAVEQQAAATREITRSVGEASAGTQAVSHNAATASRAATQAGKAAETVLETARRLEEDSGSLGQALHRFVSRIAVA